VLSGKPETLAWLVGTGLNWMLFEQQGPAPGTIHVVGRDAKKMWTFEILVTRGVGRAGLRSEYTSNSGECVYSWRRGVIDPKLDGDSAGRRRARVKKDFGRTRQVVALTGPRGHHNPSVPRSSPRRTCPADSGANVSDRMVPWTGSSWLGSVVVPVGELGESRAAVLITRLLVTPKNPDGNP